MKILALAVASVLTELALASGPPPLDTGVTPPSIIRKVEPEYTAQARAKRLALFHHDPFHDDEVIQRLHDDSIRYESLTRDGAPLEVLCAYDGLEVVL